MSVRGGARKGAGAPRKPKHLKKIFKVHSFSADSVKLIAKLAKKHSVPLSWVVDAAVQMLDQRKLTKILKPVDK